MNRFIFLLIFTYTLVYAQSSTNIIKKIEDNLNGKSAYMKISMKVTTKRTTRKITMQSYSIGSKKSFIKILYPKKDKGITFLKLNNTMWQYVPRIEKIIKIPASMMLQSWMGSDFSNDDLVKESSLSDDYRHKIINESNNSYIIKLIPTQDAAVVWGKINMEISKKYFLPLKVEYFDEDNKIVRILYYKNIKKLSDRYYPTLWEMIPRSEEKIGHKTTIIVEEAVFNKDVKESYFTKRALKRYSK